MSPFTSPVPPLLMQSYSSVYLITPCIYICFHLMTEYRDRHNKMMMRFLFQRLKVWSFLLSNHVPKCRILWGFVGFQQREKLSVFTQFDNSSILSFCYLKTDLIFFFFFLQLPDLQPYVRLTSGLCRSCVSTDLRPVCFRFIHYYVYGHN